jgi:diaminopimelate decarboxylase
MAAECMLTLRDARAIADAVDTPVFVYDLDAIRQRVERLHSTVASVAPFGFTLRYAMKANSCLALLQVLRDLPAPINLHIDASSEYEVLRAMRAGFPASRIQLTSQFPVQNVAAKFVQQGGSYNACSLLQLQRFAADCAAAAASSSYSTLQSTTSSSSILSSPPHVCLRVNPGLGSGGTNRTNVGGPASSFGVWHEQLDEALRIAHQHSVKITACHSHIGSGTDPTTWARAADLTLALVARMPDVTTVSLGGGFKVDRMLAADPIDMRVVAQGIADRLQNFYTLHKRKLHLELEPGTFLVAQHGCVLSRCVDVVSTGAQGYTFVKLDAGMNQVLRPSLYGAQHPIFVLPRGEEERKPPAADGDVCLSSSGATITATEASCIFVGPCCESGDILTPSPGDPEGLAPRQMPFMPQPGDLVVVGGCGAYCSAMATGNYNSYPLAPEVVLLPNASPRQQQQHEEGRMWRVARQRQTLEQVLENERPLY